MTSKTINKCGRNPYSKLSYGRIGLLLLFLLHVSTSVFAENKDGAADLGVDYAFLILMTLSPDFSAANYVIHDKSGSDVDISIGRFPIAINVLEKDRSNLLLELVLAYQFTEEIIPVFPDPGENIDSEWDTYGFGLGLEYEYVLTDSWTFSSGLRYGLARMHNKAKFYGENTLALKPFFDGTYFNWKTWAGVTSFGFGFRYNWKFGDRSSTLRINGYRSNVDSFSESNPAIEFNTNANLIAAKADMVFPTGLMIAGERLDFVLLLGINTFVGENRNTLGYNLSYQAGIGSEFPLQWEKKHYGHLRLSGQFLWARNMRGWLWSIGYNPE